MTVYLFLPNLGYKTRPCFGGGERRKQNNLKPQILHGEMTQQGKEQRCRPGKPNSLRQIPGTHGNTGENCLPARVCRGMGMPHSLKYSKILKELQHFSQVWWLPLNDLTTWENDESVLGGFGFFLDQPGLHGKVLLQNKT